MLDAARADALADALDLRLERLRLCPLCLFGVSAPLQAGDEREVRRALRYFAPLLWDEGLEQPLRAALEEARAAGVEHAAAGLADVEAHGPRSRVVAVVVRRLAAQQAEEVERAYITSLN